MIVPAKHSEISEILALTRACGAHLVAQGIQQWDENYPNKTAFTTDINRKELYVLKAQQRIIGTLVISTFMDAEYQDVDWITPSQDNLYIHRLAVHPDQQGQGRARELMDWAYAFAKARKAPSIRLDTFSQNARNQRFYEARGYVKCGEIYFPRIKEYPFYCYERVL